MNIGSIKTRYGVTVDVDAEENDSGSTVVVNVAQRGKVAKLVVVLNGKPVAWTGEIPGQMQLELGES